MSHVGSKPIIIPSGITVNLTDDRVTVKSASAELSHPIPAGLKLSLKKNELVVTAASAPHTIRSLHGLIRSVINNMIIGLTQGYSKTLELQGTGYRVRQLEDKDQGIELSLGFSHPLIYHSPSGIKLEVKENKFIIVSGFDKQLVGQVAANLRDLRKPDSYKGKGIRYLGEFIKLKPGKAAKATEV